MPEYLTTEEAAKYLCLAPSTLETWRSRKRGPKYVKLESAVRYTRDDLNAYAEANAFDPGDVRFGVDAVVAMQTRLIALVVKYVKDPRDRAKLAEDLRTNHLPGLELADPGSNGAVEAAPTES